MALKTKYPEDFERIYYAYPNWPKGRTSKQASYRKFVIAKKELDLTDDDINEIVGIIEQMKLDHERWQPGNPYGPKALESWIHNRMWQDDYPKIKRDRYDRANEHRHTESHEDAMARIRLDNPELAEAIERQHVTH